MAKEKMKVVRKGTQLTREELAGYPVVAHGMALPDENAIYAFESDQAFNDWIKGTEHAERVRHVDRLVAEARKDEKRDITVGMQRQKKAEIKRITDQLDDLSRKTGLDVASKELLLKAEEGGIFGSVLVLFDGVNLQSPWLPLVGPQQNLGWYGWNDRASSFFVSGIVRLSTGIWFGGDTEWLIGFPYYTGDLRYNDMHSSAYVV
jgi:hypothetical protein